MTKRHVYCSEYMAKDQAKSASQRSGAWSLELGGVACLKKEDTVIRRRLVIYPEYLTPYGVLSQKHGTS